MPGIIERPKMTRAMYQALKRHVQKEREKKKQEREQGAALERERQERALRIKKAQEDNNTLEQITKQLEDLQKKMESLKSEKHDMFTHLKKVLNQEEETRKRQQQKDDMAQSLGPYSTSTAGTVPGHPGMYLQNQLAAQPTRYMTHGGHGQPLLPHGIKRGRSPSPTQIASYTTARHQAPYSAIVKQETTYVKQEPYIKQEAYSTATSMYPQTTVPTGAQYPGVSVPSSYPYGTPYPPTVGHLTQREHYTNRQAPGAGQYTASGQARGFTLQQQLEQASHQSGFSTDADKYKTQPMRPLPHPPAQQHKGGITSGYPVARTQPPSARYQQQPPQMSAQLSHSKYQLPPHR